jgi:hypothetical protein
MDIADRSLNCLDDIRCPAIKDLLPQSVDMLHHSLVDIAHLRRGIEDARRQIVLSSRAVHESQELRRRLHMEGF